MHNMICNMMWHHDDKTTLLFIWQWTLPWLHKQATNSWFLNSYNVPQWFSKGKFMSILMEMGEQHYLLWAFCSLWNLSANDMSQYNYLDTTKIQAHTIICNIMCCWDTFWWKIHSPVVWLTFWQLLLALSYHRPARLWPHAVLAIVAVLL